MRTLTVAVLAVAVTATFVPAHGATADVPRCHGHRATLVGTPDLELLRGTPGRDVIVTNGAGKVEARSGDDLICVTSGTFVNDGRGDDVIDARAVPTKNQIYATLSRGNDTWIFGSQGTIHLDNANNIFVGRRGDRELRPHPNPPEGRFRHRVEEEFINAIRGIEPVSQNTFEIGVRYMEWTEAVHRSAESARSVSLPLAL